MRREPAKLISEVIGNYIKEDHLEAGLLMARVFEAWEIVSGSKEYTSRKFYKDKVLTCTISSSVVRTTLRYNLESYKNQINTLLQGNYVERIVLS